MNNLKDIIRIKNTKLIVSADLDKMSEIISLATLIGDKICALKLHIEIVKDFTMEAMNELIKKYEKELKFLNERLETAIYIGSNQKIRIKSKIEVYEKVLSDLRALANVL